jgi:hypothetical protein
MQHPPERFDQMVKFYFRSALANFDQLLTRGPLWRSKKAYLQVEDFSEFGKGKKLRAGNRRVYPL